MSEARCRDCRFWESDPEMIEDQIMEDGEGFCHRRAPLPILVETYPAGGPLIFWPRTCEDDWCGEFEPTGRPSYRVKPPHLVDSGQVHGEVS